MKYLILILFILQFTVNIYSDGPSAFTVMSEVGLNLYKNTNFESELIATIPFGGIVYSTHLLYSTENFKARYKYSEIDGVKGYWVDANYNDKTGYVFSPYIYHGNNIITLPKENQIRVTQEGICYGEMDYHPDLNWYGLYFDSEAFFLKKVNVTMYLNKVHGNEIFRGYECVEKESILLKADQAIKSIFLFGTQNELHEGKIVHTYYNPKPTYGTTEGFLFPEQTIDLPYRKFNNYLRAYESVIVDSSYNYTKHYQLEYVMKDRTYRDNPEIITNLNEPLFISHSAKDHCRYLTPKLYWAGDINNDDVLDLIIYRHGMVKHGGTFWSYTLIQSETKDGQIKMKKIDTAQKVSCH
jgi:hypothetical protein